jgi:hypothetical protein
MNGIHIYNKLWDKTTYPYPTAAGEILRTSPPVEVQEPRPNEQ